MIYTGYFAKLSTYKAMGLIPVSIARITPKWLRYDKQIREIKEFAPDYDSILSPYKSGEIDDKEYERRYKSQISRVDISSVLDKYRNKDIILLCYEKDERSCHRHILSEILREKGYEVTEFLYPDSKSLDTDENAMKGELNMSYEANYNASKEKYDQIHSKWEAVTSSPAYQMAARDMSFSYLKMLYLAKRIEIWSHASVKPTFLFDSVQDALTTYRDITHYKDKVNSILDSASMIVTADNLAIKLNTYVTMNDYLESSLSVDRNEKVADIAKECLQILPEMDKYITKDFITSFKADMIATFDDSQIRRLAEKGVFAKEDIDSLIKKNVNVKAICEYFGVENKPVKSYTIRLKGTSFPNDDGSSRQQNLKELSEYTGNVNLTVKPYIYTPEIGDPEPAALVLWENKGLGNLPRDVAMALDGEYKDKVLTASLSKIVGGGSVSYGIEINLDVCERVCEQGKDTEQGEEDIER